MSEINDVMNATMSKIKEMVDAQYAEGRNTTMSDEELCAMVREVIPVLADRF